jgi:DNA-binding CsgD family transcriptional regulator
VIVPVLFPMMQISLTDELDGRLLLTFELMPGYRECRPYFEATVGTFRISSTVIGLPPAEVEPLELTGTRGVYRIQLPASRTFVDRTKRRISAAFRDHALREMASDRDELLESLRKLQATTTDLERRTAERAKEEVARLRLEAALTRVLQTVTNAAFFVTNGAVAGANSAGELALERGGAALSAAILTAMNGGSTAQFEVSGMDAAGQTLVLRKGLSDEVERRLELASARWALSPRHRGVLSALVEGLSNAEIAERFECTLRTVEAHITSLLQRADASSRLQLVATFWGDLG